jgi:hypothetical protein
MTYIHKQHNYSARRIRRYSYPNAAEPGYFLGKLLDGITALVTGMGAVTLIVYFLTF